jgi:hypothetical protein
MATRTFRGWGRHRHRQDRRTDPPCPAPCSSAAEATRFAQCRAPCPIRCGLAIPLIRQIIAGGQRSASNPVHKVGWEPCGCTAGHTRHHLLVPALRARVGGPAVRADRGRHLAGAGFGPAELAAPTRGAVTDGGGGVRWPPRRPSTRGASPLFSGWWRAPRVVHRPRPNPGIGRHAHQTGITRTDLLFRHVLRDSGNSSTPGPTHLRSQRHELCRAGRPYPARPPAASSRLGPAERWLPGRGRHPARNRFIR